MPFINIAIAKPQLSPAEKQALFQETTRLMAEVLGKKPELTAVRIDCQSPENWAISGQAAQETTAQLTAVITAGTNSAEQKAAFLAQASAMLKQVLGPLALASYIVIREEPADSWGYDGQSQAARALATH